MKLSNTESAQCFKLSILTLSGSTSPTLPGTSSSGLGWEAFLEVRQRVRLSSIARRSASFMCSAASVDGAEKPLKYAKAPQLPRLVRLLLASNMAVETRARKKASVSAPTPVQQVVPSWQTRTAKRLVTFYDCRPGCAFSDHLKGGQNVCYCSVTAFPSDLVTRWVQSESVERLESSALQAPASSVYCSIRMSCAATCFSHIVRRSRHKLSGKTLFHGRFSQPTVRLPESLCDRMTTSCGPGKPVYSGALSSPLHDTEWLSSASQP